MDVRLWKLIDVLECLAGEIKIMKLFKTYNYKRWCTPETPAKNSQLRVHWETWNLPTNKQKQQY